MAADNLHAVTIEYGRGFPSLAFTCKADAASDPECHMVCPEPECEEGCGDETHVRKNIGECCIVTWLEASDAEECIYGAETRITVPIVYSWHGEGVDWAFAEVTP